MKITAIIPTLNPTNQILNVISNCLAHGFERIIIVNDGSHHECQDLFTQIEAMDQCTLLIHDVNQGKGAALKTAFRYFLEHDSTHLGVVTLDDDGQHDIQDIIRVSQCLENNQDTLILGSRDFNQGNVPFKSKFGNKITSFMFDFMIKIKIGDTQTGLRAIPRSLLDIFIAVNGDRFEYETNMLLECKRQSIKLIEEKIQTIYIEKNQLSHFNPWKDSIRIYKLLFAFSFKNLKQNIKYSRESFIKLAHQSISPIFVVLNKENRRKMYKLIQECIRSGCFKFIQCIKHMSGSIHKFISSRFNKENIKRFLFLVFACIKRGYFKTVQRIKQIKDRGKKFILAKFNKQNMIKVTTECCKSIKSRFHSGLHYIKIQSNTIKNFILLMRHKEVRQHIGTLIIHGWKEKLLSLRNTLHNKSFQHKAFVYTSRILAVCTSIIVTLLIFAWGTLAIVSYGPSKNARDLFVTSVMETSGVKFLASIYFSESEIQEIIENNAVVVTNEITDGDTVVINPEENKDIVIEDVVGDTFIGKMMIVSDPSRIFVEDVQVYNENGLGDFLSDMIARTGAIAGINGGEFYDPAGYGQGGMPMGVVIKQGVLKNDSANSCVIGFDYNHKLIVGNMSGSDAINLGIQEAVSFGPALIINGERAAIYGNGGGLNPRTAIGQRSDGAVLMLVIDGRQPNSLGASYKDIADVMQQYGAVNAANLDGGSSSVLHYNGEMMNQISMVGVRRIPTAFLVR